MKRRRLRRAGEGQNEQPASRNRLRLVIGRQAIKHWRNGDVVMTGPVAAQLSGWPRELVVWVESENPETHRVSGFTRQLYAGDDQAQRLLDELDDQLLQAEVLFSKENA